jgi:hypothetical protein
VKEEAAQVGAAGGENFHVLLGGNAVLEAARPVHAVQSGQESLEGIRRPQEFPQARVAQDCCDETLWVLPNLDQPLDGMSCSPAVVVHNLGVYEAADSSSN